MTVCIETASYLLINCSFISLIKKQNNGIVLIDWCIGNDRLGVRNTIHSGTMIGNSAHILGKGSERQMQVTI